MAEPYREIFEHIYSFSDMDNVEVSEFTDKCVELKNMYKDKYHWMD